MRTIRLALVFAVLSGAWTAIAIARVTPSMRPGLRAEYFQSIDWTGPVSRARVDADISAAQLLRSWSFTPPDQFSVRWSGFLFVDRSGVYTVATTSDDGSVVYVDDRLLVDNGGTHGLITRDARVSLERGSHRVVLQYSQAGGPYQIEWRWAYEQEPLTRVPGWLLSPRPHGYLTLIVMRALGWIWPALTIVCVFLAGRLAYQLGYWPRREPSDTGPERAGLHEPGASAAARPSDTGPERAGLHAGVARPFQGRGRGSRAAWCLALFVALTIIQTWPLATNPAHLSRNDNPDTVLNEWTIAWVAHQLPRHPLHLFDANMFYPEPRTLAYSETLFVQGLMAAPMLWLGASPVLAYNIVLLAGFALTGWAMCLVVARWTDDWIAGIVSGIIVAFNAYTLTGLTHLQALHVEFLPLALYSLDALLRKPRWKPAAWLAVWFSMQALASIYLMMFTVVALAVAILVRPEDWLGQRFKDVAPKLALSAGLAAAALLPFLLPYWRLREAGFIRSLDEVGFYAATVRNYLTTPSRFYSYAGGSPALFPGIVPLVLAAVTIVSRTAFTDSRARMCLAFGLAGVLLSFGPAIAPGYEFFYTTLPLLQGIRVAARFGYLGIVAVSVLGGYGAAWLRRRFAASRRWNYLVASSILALVVLDPLRGPITYEPFDRTPSIYRLPASVPNAVSVEMPFARPEVQFRDAPYLLNSTLNWKPLLNGYSGFVSEAHGLQYVAVQSFPDRQAIAALQKLGVTHVFVHLDQFDQETISAIDREPALHRTTVDGSVALYRLDPANGAR